VKSETLRLWTLGSIVSGFERFVMERESLETNKILLRSTNYQVL
jgi:hypothetical protein